MHDQHSHAQTIQAIHNWFDNLFQNTTLTQFS